MKKEFLLSTTLFGDLEFSSEEGFFKDVTINVGGREFSTTLYLWEDFITEENQKNVLAFLENIPMMYQSARNEIDKNFKSDECIAYFYQSHLDVLEEDVLLDYFAVDDRKDITPELFIQKLEPRTIWVSLIGDGPEIDCTFDFSIDENISDELLVFRFNEAMEIYQIAHES